MEVLVLGITVIALLGYISHTNKLHLAERKDLMDRLTAKDFVEYKSHTEPAQVFEPVVVTEQDEYFREIEEMKNRL